MITFVALRSAENNRLVASLLTSSRVAVGPLDADARRAGLPCPPGLPPHVQDSVRAARTDRAGMRGHPRVL